MYILIKRLSDILISIVVIVCFIPFFIPIAIGLKCTGEGHVFYLQERIGYRKKKFRIWKLATMLKDSPNLGTGSITVKNDWRLTPMGGWLRKTKINEIPQIINVLMGDMSIVGPRPQMECDFNKFTPAIQKTISLVKPGITGIGSIIFRDEERLFNDKDLNPQEFCERFIAPYKGSLEVWYQEHQSCKTDLLLMMLTAWVIVFPNSKLPYRLCKDLPEKPKELQAL